MKKIISKIIVLAMFTSLVMLPQTAFAAVSLDETLTEWGFTEYHGPNGLNAECSVVDSEDSSHGEVLQIYAQGNVDRSNRYGGVQFNVTLESGKTYRFECDYKNNEVTVTGTDTTQCQLFTSMATSTHGTAYANLQVRLDSDFDWHHKSFTVKPTSTAVHKVQLGVAGNFVAWFDNVKIYRTDDPSVNLLPTSDFSTYTNVPRGFKDIKSNHSGELVANFEKVIENGDTVLKVTRANTGDDGDDWVGIRFIIPSSKLTVGHTYYFGFDYKKDSLDDNQSTAVLAGFGNNRGSRLTVQQTKGDALNWTWFSRDNISCTSIENFGIDIIVKRNAAMYLNNLRCYDLTSDPGKTVNLIPHGDFEPYIEVENVTFANGKATAYITNQAGTSRQAIMLAGAYDASENLVQATFGTQNTYNAQGANDAAYTAELTLPTASASSVKVFVWDNLIDCNAIGRSTLKP